MTDDPFGGGVPPEDRRGPLSGSAAMWTGLAIAMAILTVLVIVPTLGQGPTPSGVDDPFVDGPAVVPPQEPAAPDPTDDPLTT